MRPRKDMDIQEQKQQPEQGQVPEQLTETKATGSKLPGIITVLVAVGVIGLKFFKTLLIGFKAFKLAAILKTGLTMILCMWAYALVGTGGATLCWSAGLYTGNPFWFAVAYSGFFLNLFNMIPVRPLDGGRTVAAISPKLWIVSFILILFLIIRSFNPILLLILFLAGRNVYDLWKKRNMEQQEYYEVSLKGKMQLSLCYFGLLAFLGFGMSLTQVSV